MKNTPSRHFWQTIGLGAVAGMRTFTAPTFGSILLTKQSAKNADGFIRMMSSNKTTVVFGILAAAELVGDKLPTAPNRIEPGGIAGRCLAGSLTGAAIFRANDKPTWLGGLLGCSAALAVTFGAYYLRKAAVKRYAIKDPYIGAAEDLLAITTATALL